MSTPYDILLKDFENFFRLTKEYRKFDEHSRYEIVNKVADFLDEYFPLNAKEKWYNILRYDDSGIYYIDEFSNPNHSKHYVGYAKLDTFHAFFQNLGYFISEKTGVCIDGVFSDDFEFDDMDKVNKILLSACDKLIENNKEHHLEEVRKKAEASLDKSYYNYARNINDAIQKIPMSDLTKGLINLRDCSISSLPILISISEQLGCDYIKKSLKDMAIKGLKSNIDLRIKKRDINVGFE